MFPPVNRSRPQLELQMTTLIDVVFLLLIFFLWTSSFERPEYDLGGAIAMSSSGSGSAAATSATEPDTDEIAIQIEPTDQGVTIRFNDLSVSGIDQLSQRFRQIVALDVQPAVVVYPSAEVLMSDAVAVYDAIIEAGMRRVYFAVEE